MFAICMYIRSYVGLKTNKKFRQVEMSESELLYVELTRL